VGRSEATAVARRAVPSTHGKACRMVGRKLGAYVWGQTLLWGHLYDGLRRSLLKHRRSDHAGRAHVILELDHTTSIMSVRVVPHARWPFSDQSRTLLSRRFNGRSSKKAHGSV
jgi:hypothetical protein